MYHFAFSLGPIAGGKKGDPSYHWRRQDWNQISSEGFICFAGSGDRRALRVKRFWFGKK